MKKSIIFLFSIIIVLLNVAGGLNIRSADWSRMHEMDKYNGGIEIVLKDCRDVSLKDTAQFLQDRIAETEVTVIRIDNRREDDETVSVRSVLSNDFAGYLSSLPVDLVRGHYPDLESEIVASYETGIASQTGRLRDRFDDDRIIYQSMNVLLEEDKSADGSYVLSGPSEQVSILVDEIADLVGKTPEDIRYYGGFGTGEGTLYLFIIAADLILIAVLLLMFVFYPINSMRFYGVMKINGFSLRTIWKKLYSSVFLIPAGVAMMTWIIMRLMISDITISDLSSLILLTVSLFLLLGVLSLAALKVIRGTSLSNILKGAFSDRLPLILASVLKIGVVCFITVIAPTLVTNMTRLIDEHRMMKSFDAVSDQLTLADFQYVGNEFEETMRGEGDLSSKMYAMFSALEQTADAGYWSAGLMEPDSWPSYLQMPELGTPVLVQGRTDGMETIMVNQNMLRQFDRDYQLDLNRRIDWDDLSSTADRDLSNLFSEGKLYVLIPNSFDEVKREAAVRYGKILCQYSGELSVIPISYDHADMDIFSQNIFLSAQNQGILTEPAIYCYTSQILSAEPLFGTDSPETNRIRITDTPENRKEIQQAALNYGLEDNHLFFDSILNSGFARQIEISRQTTVIWVFFLLLAILVSILSSYYIVLVVFALQRKEIIVRKLQGHSRAKRYRVIVLLFALIYFVSVFWGMVAGFGSGTWIVLLLTDLADLAALTLMIHKLENGSLANLLKGENK